jgi:hypothetical protein
MRSLVVGAWWRPCPERFERPQEYYSTLFHELAHSTGHATRPFNLRNEHFAHFAGISRLNDPRVRDQLNNFLDPIMPRSILLGARFPGESAAVYKKHSKARREFMNGVMLLAMDIIAAASDFTIPPKPSPNPLIEQLSGK